MMCQHGQGVEPVRRLRTKREGGSFFAILCRRLVRLPMNLGSSPNAASLGHKLDKRLQQNRPVLKWYNSIAVEIERFWGMQDIAYAQI